MGFLGLWLTRDMSDEEMAARYAETALTYQQRRSPSRWKR